MYNNRSQDLIVGWVERVFQGPYRFIDNENLVCIFSVPEISSETQHAAKDIRYIGNPRIREI